MTVVVMLLLVFFASGCGTPKSDVRKPSRNLALEGVYRAADGGIVALRPPTDGLTVLFIYSKDCPISNFYIPVLNELVRRHGAERIRWVGVCVDTDITHESQSLHASEYAIAFPVIADKRGDLARAVGAKTTPEVAVFNAEGRLVYRGRIDDHYADRGVKASAPQCHELDDAIAAGLAGRSPAVRETVSVGCPLPEPGPKPEAKVTYAEHIAPLIYRRCLECHRTDAIAPFALETYEQARRRAADLATVTASRFMPPWRFDPRFGQRARHDLALSDAEIKLFATWVEQGAVEGDPTLLPVTPEVPGEWSLGQPDLVLEMPEPFVVPATGPDIYRCFVIPTALGKDTFVTAVEYQSSGPTTVHHVLSYLDTTGVSRVLDERDPLPGYECFGSPGSRVSGELGAAGPGFSGDRLPEGMARLLPDKADIVLQLHYHPSGKVETSRTRIGLYFAKHTVKNLYLWFPVQNTSFKIPAGASSHEIEASKKIPFDLIVHDIMPHMHLLGKEMDVWMEKPSGERVDLLRVSPWDFKWQRSCRLAEPLAAPAGSRIVARAVYDNSTRNPLNPNRLRPVDVAYGESTTDEMCIAMLGATRADGDLSPATSFKELWNQNDEDTKWSIWADTKVSNATLQRLPTHYRIDLSRDTARSKPWNVQLKHVLGIQKGLTYEISLRAKADSSRDITWGVLQNHPPYEHLCSSQAIRLTSDWQTLRKIFTADRDEPDAQIVLAVGGSSIPFEIDEATISTSGSDQAAESTGVSP